MLYQWGGCIGQQLLIDHSELFSKAILASTFCKPTKTFVEVVSNWKNLATKYKIEELNKDFYSKCFTKQYLNQYKEILPSLYLQGTKKDCDEFVMCVKSMLDFDVYDRLTQVKNRVLVINAKQDEILGSDAGEIISKQINCDYYLYVNYNHAVYDEAKDYKDRIYNYFK